MAQTYVYLGTRASIYNFNAPTAMYIVAEWR